MSQSKLDELTAELEGLRTIRKPAIAEQMNVARTRGGGDDNAETDLAKQDLAFVEGKIRSLESLIGNAVVRQIARAGDNPPDTVAMWAWVTVERENGQQVQYQITGSLEADPGQGRISHVSPIGKSLLGKRPGDITEVQIPSGKTKLKIVSVS
jgi:transcription elongation factor GreA